MSAQEVDATWPAELESLDACPVCSSAAREPLHEDLADNVFHCAPGRWRLWRCSHCGSAYLDPRPSRASIRLAYQSYYTHREPLSRQPYETLGPLQKLRRRLANGYLNRRFFSRPDRPACGLGYRLILATPPYRRAVDRYYRHLPRPAADSALLDLGCGGGEFLEIARFCGWKVEGVDPDPRAVANCRSRGLEVREGGIELYDGEREMFDAITLSHVVEHSHDPIALLEACHRLLKTGGRLWLETPNFDSRGRRRYGRDWRGLEPPRHLVLLNLRSLTTALLSAGFARIESLPDANAAASMTKASEASKLGLPADTEIALSLGTRARLLLDRLWPLAPAEREFLTVVAVKR